MICVVQGGSIIGSFHSFGCQNLDLPLFGHWDCVLFVACVRGPLCKYGGVI